ncbi:MAG: hypothetical protein KAW09_12655, partial [Thermoplasmata archaeon]|nr:hypothetical protein [Thermoplasmata archaeon]
MRDVSRRKKRKVLMLAVAVAFIVVVAGISYSILTTEHVEAIRVSGAWALYPMMVRWGEEYRTVNPELRVDVSGGGAGQGMTDV